MNPDSIQSFEYQLNAVTHTFLSSKTMIIDNLVFINSEFLQGHLSLPLI